MYELHTRKHVISTIVMQILRMRITLNGVRGLATFTHTHICMRSTHSSGNWKTGTETETGTGTGAENK